MLVKEWYNAGEKSQANTKQTLDHFKELNAMKKLENTFKKENISTDNICQQSVQKLVEIVWRYTSMYYFWIKK